MRFFVQATSGRQRFNVLGAWNAVNRELIAVTNTSVVNTVTLCERLRNIAALGLVCPWFYPTVAEYRSILEAAGFRVDRIEIVTRPTPLPTGMDGWLTTFRTPFFDRFDEPRRTEIKEEILSLLCPALCDRTGQWAADYVRLRVAASKPA